MVPPPISDALADFCKTPPPSQAEMPADLRSILEASALTGLYWHDWQQLKHLLDFRLEQVLQEYNAERVAVEVGPPRPLASGESFDELRRRQHQALDSFNNGAPFTLQRLCELLLNPRGTYPCLDKLALALEKLLLVTSMAPCSDEPYPSLPLPGERVEALYRPLQPRAAPAAAARVAAGDGSANEGAAAAAARAQNGLPLPAELDEDARAAAAANHRAPPGRHARLDGPEPMEVDVRASWPGSHAGAGGGATSARPDEAATNSEAGVRLLADMAAPAPHREGSPPPPPHELPPASNGQERNPSPIRPGPNSPPLEPYPTPAEIARAEDPSTPSPPRPPQQGFHPPGGSPRQEVPGPEESPMDVDERQQAPGVSGQRGRSREHPGLAGAGSERGAEDVRQSQPQVAAADGRGPDTSPAGEASSSHEALPPLREHGAEAAPPGPPPPQSSPDGAAGSEEPHSEGAAPS